MPHVEVKQVEPAAGDAEMQDIGQQDKATQPKRNRNKPKES